VAEELNKKVESAKELLPDILTTIQEYLKLANSKSVLDASTSKDIAAVLAVSLELLKFSTDKKEKTPDKDKLDDQIKEFTELLNKE